MTTFNENKQDLLAAVEACIKESKDPKKEQAIELGQLPTQALQNVLEAGESLGR